MTYNDGPSSFEERMNALRNRVENWKSNRASADGSTPIKFAAADEAKQWPRTPEFRARSECVQKENFFSSLLLPPAEDPMPAPSGKGWSRRSPSPMGGEGSRSETPPSPARSASPSRASTAKPNARNAFDAEMARLEQRMRSWQCNSNSPVKASSSSPKRTSPSKIKNWTSPIKRIYGDVVATDRRTRSSSPCSSRRSNIIAGQYHVEPRSPYYIDRLSSQRSSKDVLGDEFVTSSRLTSSRMSSVRGDAEGSFLHSRRQSTSSARDACDDAGTFSRRGSIASALGKARGASRGSDANSGDHRRGSSSPPLNSSSSPSRYRLGSALRPELQAPNIFQKAQADSRGISPNGTPAYKVAASLQCRSQSPSSTARSMDSYRRDIQIRSSSADHLTQRVTHLEDSMHNIEHMLSCLVRNAAGAAETSRSGQRNRSSRGLRAVSEDAQEEVRRLQQHQKALVASSTGKYIKGGKSRGLYRYDRSGGKLLGSSEDHRTPWNYDVPPVMEAIESDASPSAILFEAPRSRFRWPMDLKAAKEELRLEVQESLATRPF